jgi:hypothetical protein
MEKMVADQLMLKRLEGVCCIRPVAAVESTPVD